MKRSITVLGVEAEGIRGVRLEENGADWSCVDSEFWSIGGKRPDDAGAPSQDDESVKSGSLSAEYAELDSELTTDERYAATVDALKAAAKRFDTSEIVLSMPLASLLVKVVRTSVDARDRLSETAGVELGKVLATSVRKQLHESRVNQGEVKGFNPCTTALLKKYLSE